MKSVTEFASFTLNQGLKAKSALAAEGKTPEEIEAGLGASFKYEGEKLKHFVNAIDVASQNAQNLKRVMVVTLSEGEIIPNKSIKVEEHHYVPEFINEAKPAPKADATKGGRSKGRGGRGGGEKGSPWGLSPEQKAAKKNPAPKAT